MTQLKADLSEDERFKGLHVKDLDSLNNGLLACYGIKNAKLEEIKGGLINSSYRVYCEEKCYYLKVFCDRFLSKINTVHDYMMELKQLDFPVAQIISKNKSDEHQNMVLYEFVEGFRHDFGKKTHFFALGEQLGHLLEASDEINSGRIIGESEAKIKFRHVCAFRKLAKDYSFGIPLLNAFEELSRLSYLIEPIASDGSKLCFCHGDFTLRNVLFNKQDEITLISDFDECGFRPLLYEVASTIVKSCFTMDPQRFLNAPGKLQDFSNPFILGIRNTFEQGYYHLLKNLDIFAHYVMLECLNGISWRVNLAILNGNSEDEILDIVRDRLDVCLWVESNFRASLNQFIPD